PIFTSDKVGAILFNDESPNESIEPVKVKYVPAILDAFT
ncbi:uncharacterized protein METZ01_LOCUS245298, partial [marine metagenome]